MTCGLHTKLNAAVVAAREALTAALDADVSNKELDNLVCAYKGLKSVSKTLPTGITFVPDTVAGNITFNNDINLGDVDLGTVAATNVSTNFTVGNDFISSLGSDVITIPDDLNQDT